MDHVLSVLKFIGILLEVVLIFNLLIIVHELGHFLAAKWRGLYIERFGIWFGKPIWEKKIGGIWYSLGSIPAGGFVKLPQLAPMEALEGETEIPKDQLKPISPLDKIIVAFAGPLFSFMLAIVFACLVWTVGRPVGEADRTTTIGDVMPESPAEGKLLPGDVLTKIDGHPVTRYGGQGENSIMWRIVASEDPTVKVEYLRDGKPGTAEIAPVIEKTKWYERRGMRRIGISPKNRPMVAEVKKGSNAEKAGFQTNDVLSKVGGQPILDEGTLADWAGAHPGEPLVITVERGSIGADGHRPTADVTFVPSGLIVEALIPDSPASRAGLKPGDRLLKADDKPVPFVENLSSYLRLQEGKPVKLAVERDKKPETLTVTPERPIDGAGEKPKPSIGAVFKYDDGLAFDQYGYMSPIYPSVAEQISDGVGAMVQTVKKVTSSKSNIGVQHMGGPVMMMRIYYLLFESPEGPRLVLWFSVILNINLALLNMLPLPVLDGGHITLAIIEGIRKKPVNVRVLEWVQTACALMIIGFMLFVTIFDVQDVFGGKKSPTIKFKPAATTPSQG
jgi:regulator of sigma E protease